MIYHITTRLAWEQAQVQGVYTTDSLESEGFIHCSTDSQVQATANRFFIGRQDLVLLIIDEHKVKAEIRFENLEGGTDRFPHVYGAIPVNAVEMVIAILPDRSGFFVFDLPE
jgi:uncharacterized protein (DUF952 family)